MQNTINARTTDLIDFPNKINLMKIWVIHLTWYSRQSQPKSFDGHVACFVASNTFHGMQALDAQINKNPRKSREIW